MAPNRVVVALLFTFGLAGAVLPVAANMDWASTAGILGGLATVCTAGSVFLLGWQKHEERTARNAGQPDALVNVQTSSGNASASFGNAAGVFSGAEPAVEGDEDPPPLNAKPDGELLA